MSTADLTTIANLAESILSGSNFFLSTVVSRLRQAANAHPHDQGIRTAQHVVENKFAKEGSLGTISQKEVQSIYDEVMGLGNKSAFRSYMDEFLLHAAPVSTEHRNEDYIGSLRSSGRDIDLGDSAQADQLTGLFTDAQEFTQKFIESGRTGVELELRALGFDNPDVEIAAKNDQFVVYAAGVESTGGRFAALIPAEIKQDTVLMPSAFVFGEGFAPLSADNLMAHAQHLAQGGKAASASSVLEHLTKTVEVQEQVSFAEDDHISLHAPGLYSTKIVEEMGTPVTEIPSQPEVEMPEALMGLSSSAVEEALLQTGLSYDRDVIVAAKTLVGNELNNFGIQYDKLTVASEYAGGLVVTANIRGQAGTKTIEVPIEILNGRLLMPSAFTSGVTVKAFDEKELKSFAHDTPEGVYDAAFSTKSDLNYNELHKLVLKNAAYGNFMEVEESLAVIQNRFGEQFHRMAFNDLLDLLNMGFAVEKTADQELDEMIKQASQSAKDRESNIKMTDTLMYLYGDKTVVS